ncbi:Excitatory amino acid transporter 2 [Taenia crassiceps]|uniref:Excitatory amino acid transporter 2 n=1 Tax=Taenia crassiceps TaxID=6207 RepID=A0ABR4QW07_9CEST
MLSSLNGVVRVASLDILMRQENVETDTFSFEPTNVSDGDDSLALVLSDEIAEEKCAAMSGAGKSMDGGVSLASLNRGGDRGGSAEDIDEMTTSFAPEGISDEELENTFEKVGMRRDARNSRPVSGSKKSATYDKESTQNINDAGLVSTSNSRRIGDSAVGIFKLPAGLPPPRLLKAGDDDVIDLLEDENPSKSAKDAHLNKLLSRFIDSMKAADLNRKTDSKTIEYSIVTRVPDAQTGRFSLQLDTVAYKPNLSKAVTFTDRRMWARHRLELQAIMRSKRLRHYDERMQHNESAQISSKKSGNDSDEVEEWLEYDESDTSTETEQEEDGVGEDEDEDGDEISNLSRIRKRVNPFVDDEAEESDDVEDLVDPGTSELNATEICETLSSNSPAAAEAYQGLASRACVEPGEVDLFAIDTTLLVNSMTFVYIHLESLEAHDTSKMFSFAHDENTVPCDVSSAKILNRSWNGTPYSMLFSQKQVSFRDSTSEYSSMENNKSEENLSNSLPSQTQICLDSTQPTFSEDIIDSSPGGKAQFGPDPEVSCLTQTQVLAETEKGSVSPELPLHVDPLVEESGRPRLMRVRESHESVVANAFSAQASLSTLASGQSLLDASNISLFSSYDGQPQFLSDVQTTQSNAELLANTDTEFSAEMKVQLVSVSRRRLKRLHHDSGGNSDGDVDFECASKRGTLVPGPTLSIKGNTGMREVPDESQAKSTHLADSDDILSKVGDEDGEGEAGDCYDFSGIEGASEGTEFSSNSEKEFVHIPERGESHPKYKPMDFIDEEAELSGDEAERAIYMDEEEDIDDDSDLHSLKDFVDEKEMDDRTGKLRREVERVYNRIQNDDDQRRIRYLKEMFLDDGDLYEEEGRVRQRRFRWRGLEKENQSFAKGTESDEEDEEGEEEGEVEGAGVFPALVSQGAGVMSRWLLRGSSSSLSREILTAGSASASSKDADTPRLLVESMSTTSKLEFDGSSASACSLSHSHKESQRCSLDPLQKTISGKSVKSSSGSHFLDSTGNPSHTPDFIPLTKYGSILSRSATLLPSSSRLNATAAPYARHHADKEVDVADPSLSGAGDACGSSDTGIKTFGPGLRSKVDLSCFSMKADSRTVAAPKPISSRTHFTKSTNLQPLQAPSRTQICPTNPSSTNTAKSKFKTVVVGTVLGIILQKTNPSDDVLLWIGMPGEIFIRLLKLTIIPLIVATVIIVTSTLDLKENGKISAVALAFITTSNMVAAICGTVASLLLKPGHSTSANASITNQTFTTETPPKTSDVFADMLYNLFPDNVLGIALFQSRTLHTPAILRSGNETAQRTIQKVDSVNMLGLLFCSFVFGTVAGSSGEQGKAFLDFFKSISCIIFKIMNIFLRFTPIGVCAMIAGPIAGLRDLSNTFSQLGLFMVTVIAALVAHMIIIFVIYASFTRSNPLRLLPYCFRTWLISIATLAPVVTIPDMYNASDAFGVDPRVSRFVVPLTAALKGDGSAAFLGASAIFIAQLTNTPITPAMVVIIILLSTAAVFTLPNIPSSSLVILVTILASLGVGVNYVGLLFAIDWFMDRCRTTNLAVLHLYCVAFTHLICHGKLHRNESPDDANGVMPIPVKRNGLEGGAFISLKALDTTEENI